MFKRACILVVVISLSMMLICPSARAHTMIHGWSKGFVGGSDHAYGYDVAVDSAGNTLLAGEFSDTVNFGGGTLTGGGVFLAKFDASGNHLWSKSFANAGVYYSKCLAIDDAGNVVLAGCFENTVDFGGGALTSAGYNDIFLAKFDASGNHIWSKRFGDWWQERVEGVAVDGDGNVIMAGYFSITVDFGGGVLTCAGGGDIFLAKFDPAGTHIWSQRFGDADNEYGCRVVTDSEGNIVLAGEFFGTLNLGGAVLTSEGVEDIFLAKFNASGTHLWSLSFGGESDQAVNGMARDCAGNIAVAGCFRGTMTIGGGVLTSAGDDYEDIFLAKFDASGTHLWSQRFGDAYSDIAYDVTIDGRGNVIMTGQFRGDVDFGGGALSALSSEMFVAKFNASCSHLWSNSFPASIGYGVTVDDEENAIVTGSYEGYADFGGGDLPYALYNSIFLAKFFCAEPRILTINDVPNDQGKQVRISWQRSGYDRPGSLMPIIGYSIFRRIDASLASSQVFDLSKGDEPVLTYPPGEWDFVVSAPARAEREYFMVVPTLADSTKSGGPYYTTFFVSALTSTPGVYFDSEPDSGSSVDNLSPKKVGGFAVAYNTGSGNELTWDENEEADVAGYCIYRGSTPDFTPDAASLADVITATAWTDSEHDGSDVHYKITAVDDAGNESEPACPGTTTAVEEPAIPQMYALYPNVPNPFNPSTAIFYDVPVGGGAVVLRIYDVTGRLMRTLVNGPQPAGERRVTWDGKDESGRGVASGVYFYRLQAPGYDKTLKMVLLR